MDENISTKIDNTIKVLYEILEKDKDNPNITDAFEEAKNLIEKRNIK